MYRYITEFTTYLHDNNIRQHTINAYTQDVHQWAVFCMEHGVYDIAHLQQYHIDTYIEYLYRTYITLATAQRKCSALRSFFRYCAISLDVPEMENSIDIFCTNRDIVNVCKRLFSSDDPYSHRDGCLIYLQYELSASYKYIASFKTHEIIWHNTTATMRNKRISKYATYYLHNYIMHSSPYICGTYTTQLVFPYTQRHNIMMLPYRTYIRKLRHYLAQQHAQQSPDIPFGDGRQEIDIDTTLQRRYTNFHDRA